MGWLSRFGRGEEPATPEPQAPSRFPALEDATFDDDGIGPLRPRERGLGEAEVQRIRAGLAGLAERAIAVDDIEAIGAGYDREYEEWAAARSRQRPDHAEIVDRYAIAIGEYLTRQTDLRWRIVTDVFGTDLALADRVEGEFVVVPGNLVAARWMRGETGWIPGVVRHLVRVRDR